MPNQYLLALSASYYEEMKKKVYMYILNIQPLDSGK